MKTKMIVALVLLAVLALVFPVQAQTYTGSGGAVVVAGTTATAAGNLWTNRIAGSTSVTNYTRYAVLGPNVTVQYDFVMADAGTTNQTIWLGYSNRPESNYVILLPPFQVAANGTGIAKGATNIGSTISGAKYVWVCTITNAFTTAGHYLTNYNVYINSR